MSRRSAKVETGYVEGQNVSVEYHWLASPYDRLPALIGDLVRRQVAAIATIGTPHVALTAKAATATIPIVFAEGIDPVELGLVPSLAQPGGNVTGIYFLVTETTAKRLRLLHELVPKAVRVAVLLNPANASVARTTSRDAQGAAPSMGLNIQILNASTIGEIDAAFATLVRERADALFVDGDALFLSRRQQFVTLTARDRIPAAYSQRDYVEAGGLMSYGTSIVDFASSSRRLYGQNSQRRQARRSAGSAIDQIRVCDQPSNGASAWHRGSARADLDRRRRVRIGCCFAALHGSAFGTKQTWASAPHMSAFGGKADIG